LEFFVGIVLVLVLLSFEKSTNTNTIPAFGMVFQYNTICILYLRYFCPTPFSSSNIQNLLQMQSWALFAANCILATKRPARATKFVG
jgi:hypothetical protein